MTELCAKNRVGKSRQKVRKTLTFALMMKLNFAPLLWLQQAGSGRVAALLNMMQSNQILTKLNGLSARTSNL